MSFSASNIANINSAATTVSNLPANTAITLRWTPTNVCAYDDIILNRQTLQLSVKALLAGPLSSATGKMSDALRTLNVIPTTSPYGNSETIDPSVLTTTGDNAIVDWVQVQLRSNASTVVATQAALIQRDGDIVGLDGISALEFTQSPDNYYVNVLHRNHLGVMTAAAVALSYSTTNVDFSVSTTATYGTNAQRVVGSYRALWAGDADGDKTVKYAGANNDRAAILTALGATPAILQYPVYNNADTDMNGILKYYGTRSENYPIIITVVSNGGNSTTVVTQQF